MCRRRSRVHADLSAGDALMRDTARFHFGFTVPFVPHMGAAGVVAAVSASKGDLGLVPAFAVAGARRLVDRARIRDARRRSSPGCRSSTAPTIRPPLPVFVVSRVAADAMVDRGRDLERARRRLERRGRRAALSPLAEFIAVPDRAFDGAALLVSVPARRRRSTHITGGAGQGRRHGALGGPRRQPRDPLYGRRRRKP